jgi:hypothetical protein
MKVPMSVSLNAYVLTKAGCYSIPLVVITTFFFPPSGIGGSHLNGTKSYPPLVLPLLPLTLLQHNDFSWILLGLPADDVFEHSSLLLVDYSKR